MPTSIAALKRLTEANSKIEDEVSAQNLVSC